MASRQAIVGWTEMTTKAKPFQLATVDAVLNSFRKNRKFRRFLVADEVGLGKTVVAKEVIKRMMQRRRKHLTVFYMCSNLAIAKQNKDNLLKLLPADEREDAECQVDRLSLLSIYEPPQHPKLHLYSLTPDTSIPVRKKRRRDGRQEERALIHVLLKEICPEFFREVRGSVFRRQANKNWKRHIREQNEIANVGALKQAFRDSVRKELGVAPRKQLLPRLREFRDKDNHLALIAHMRNALAASAIEQVEPDLVIFDEFQKFRDLLSPDLEESERRVIGRLRGEDSQNPPALLLLSATPYRLFTRRWEDESGSEHRSEFFELIEFLYGGNHSAKKKRDDTEAAFELLEGELRKGDPKSETSDEARKTIEGLLRPIMARTERASHRQGWGPTKTQRVNAAVHHEDLEVFRHLTDSLDNRHKSYSVPYWTSIPLPMQTMGNHYVAWRESKNSGSKGVPKLTKTMRNSYQRLPNWPHPRMRALLDHITPKQLSTPWLPPTVPWWELKGIWASEDRIPHKLLVFSRFWAVPQTIASTLSFNMESAIVGRDGLSYKQLNRRKLLSATENRHALLGLFHPSPFLVDSTDPLLTGKRKPSELRTAICGQLKSALASIDVTVQKGSRHIPTWQLLAQLETKTDNWEWVSDSWWRIRGEVSKAEDDNSGLAQLLNDWDEKAGAKLNTISQKSFNELVEYALGSPGVAIGRSLKRHWEEAVTKHGFYSTLGASWIGLRNYLDQRWFYHSLRRKKEKYPRAIRRAVIEGNLEAVLDEHLWITSQLRNMAGAELADELKSGFDVKSGTFSIHPLDGDRENTFSLRSHAALPFTQQRSASLDDSKKKKRIRTDDLRRAFNTPFWPYVLATTSVGQEGLDFHAWCDSLLHWDLCRNPVDLEQREGRIQRYGGLSIRRGIAKTLKPEALSDLSADTSPWSHIQKIADERLGDESGLMPWWVCEGGNVNRYIFEVPTSEQNHWFEWMQEQRLLYRLALGQPNQEDLLEVLRSKGSTNPEDVREAVINLSPWFSKQHER